MLSSWVACSLLLRAFFLSSTRFLRCFTFSASFDISIRRKSSSMLICVINSLPHLLIRLLSSRAHPLFFLKWSSWNAKSVKWTDWWPNLWCQQIDRHPWLDMRSSSDLLRSSTWPSKMNTSCYNNYELEILLSPKHASNPYSIKVSFLGYLLR